MTPLTAPPAPMLTAPVGAWRAAWLLAKLRWRRQFNQIGSLYRYRIGLPGRKATSRTSPTTWLITALVTLTMLGGFTALAYQSVTNMENVLGSTLVRNPHHGAPGVGDRADLPQPVSRLSLRRLPAAPGSVLPAGVVQGATLQVTLLLVAALFLTLASKEITRADWDLEWLVTLPLPLSTLLASRLAERTVTNLFGLLTLAPFLSILAWHCGYRWTAPLLGIGLTLALLVLVATAWMLVDTGLRLALPPPALRNLHAAISIIGLPPYFLAISTSSPNNTFVLGWAAALPEAMQWLPTGLAVRALASADVGSAAFSLAVMIGEILLCAALGLALLQRQVRNGIVAAGAREAVARAPRLPHQPARAVRTQARTLISAVQRRELRLLGRDRTFMVQTLVLPALIVGVQIFLNSGANVFVGAVEHPAHLSAIAFGLAAYTLMFSAFQTLNAEGQALWILYCVPQPLESILRQKAILWATAATLYPLVIFAIAVAMAGDISLQFVGSAAIVLIGVPIFAVIATALGVFGCDPLAQEVQRRVRITYLYLYMLIASLYAYAVYASDFWQRAALIVLTALLAIALWQKARDQFDYLLDPSASPPPRVSVSDGLIAALMFFVLQALVGLLATGRGQILSGRTIWIAFCIAGATTFAIMQLVYWRAHTTDKPRLLGERVPQALLWGLAGGVAAALAALAYLQIIVAMDLFAAARHVAQLVNPTVPLWLAALAIVAAPLFEEFIFRGLIFTGLRRSLGLAPAAVASAAIFAIVHPPMSVVPVFVMGVCAALVYDRTKMLAAPITVHAVYNVAVLALQWSLMPGAQ
jgi:ABC-2 type transport system permease protein